MPESQRPWQQGLSLLQQGRSQEAADLLWRAATDDPGCFEARLYLGLALGQLQRHEEAARELRAALSINPQSALAQYNLGVVLQSAGRHQEAVVAYEAALAIDPGYEQARQAAQGLRAALGPLPTAPPAPPPGPPTYPAPEARAAPRDTGTGRRTVLIVVGVVAAFLLFIVLIVAAVVFPAFRGAGEKARQASCQSNLKQLALAQQMYAADHDGLLPAADDWCDATMPYTGNPAILACPSARGLQWGYAMNADLSGVNQRELDDPGQTVLMYDSTAGTSNANDSLGSLPVPGRHIGGNNFAFADGHVNWFSDSAPPSGSKAPDLTTEPEEGYQP